MYVCRLHFIAGRADMLDTGMPQEWQKLLDDNGITRAEQEQNPDKVSWSPLYPGVGLKLTIQVLAVVQYFQNRDAPENEEEEIWQKMAGAGPSHGVTSPSGFGGGRDMSRENSHDAQGPRLDNFANPVCPVRVYA